jgi:hypothetical protein
MHGSVTGFVTPFLRVEVCGAYEISGRTEKARDFLLVASEELDRGQAYGRIFWCPERPDHHGGS